MKINREKKVITKFTIFTRYIIISKFFNNNFFYLIEKKDCIAIC